MSISSQTRPFVIVLWLTYTKAKPEQVYCAEVLYRLCYLLSHFLWRKMCCVLHVCDMTSVQLFESVRELKTCCIKPTVLSVHRVTLMWLKVATLFSVAVEQWANLLVSKGKTSNELGYRSRASIETSVSLIHYGAVNPLLSTLVIVCASAGIGLVCWMCLIERITGNESKHRLWYADILLFTSMGQGPKVISCAIKELVEDVSYSYSDAFFPKTNCCSIQMLAMFKTFPKKQESGLSAMCHLVIVELVEIYPRECKHVSKCVKICAYLWAIWSFGLPNLHISHLLKSKSGDSGLEPSCCVQC